MKIMKNIHLVLVSLLLLSLASCQTQPTEELKWNFDNFKKLTYDYQQFMETASPFEKGEVMLNEAKGSLVVSINDKGKADLIFKDVQMSMLKISEDGDTSRIMKNKAPDFFMQDMDEYGKIEGPLNQQTELLAQVLFPIPQEKIGPGEQAKIPTAMPFNMFGSRIIVSGFNTLSLESVEDGLAILSTDLDVSEYEIPKDADANYDCYMIGNSRYTFDMASGYFHNADLKLELAAKSITDESEEAEEEDESELDKMLKDFSENFGMEMKTRIHLSLKDKE